MQDDRPLFVDIKDNAPREGLPFVERNAIVGIVRDPHRGKYLGLRWKEVDWETFVTGGIEEGQTGEEAARAEVLEETGYKNLQLVQELRGFHSQFYHHPKKCNRFAHVQAFLFNLVDDERVEIAEEDKGKFELVWLTPEELESFRLPEGNRYSYDHIKILGL